MKLIGGALVLLAGGITGGLFIPQDGLRATLAQALLPEQDEKEKASPDQGKSHIDLSRNAQRNLGLVLGEVHPEDFIRTLKVPGEIVEKPAYSDLAVSTTLAGIVTRIHAVPGQAVEPGDRLFDLQLTGEPLAAAQSALLKTLQQLETINAELARISPLAEKGSVAGKKRLALQYSRRETEADKHLREQELLVRGLEPAQVASIIARRILLREFTIRVPEYVGRQAGPRRPPARGGQSASSVPPRDGREYTIEALTVFPGKAVKAGDLLCRLAHHAVLYVQGQAFENEIEAVGKLDERGWRVSLELGTEGHEGKLTGLRVLYLDNHVHPDSQTFNFYVPLANEVLADTFDEQGRRYRSWKYKPGQRMHVIVPVEKFERRLKLPVDAFVREGLEAFVFRLKARNQKRWKERRVDNVGRRMASKYSPIEVHPVQVHVLREDSDFVVVAADGKLRPGDVIAMNNAYQLQLALKSDSGGGAHHGHTH